MTEEEKLIALKAMVGGSTVTKCCPPISNWLVVKSSIEHIRMIPA